MDKKVSVIIPTYGGSDKISRAIDSVLNQTYSNIEIIVVDDNNPDSYDRKKTSEAVNKFDRNNIIYVKHSINKNGAAARNSGLNVAKGDYICFLDDDDFIFPSRIEKSVKYLESNPSYYALYCNVILTDKKGIYNTVKAEKVINKEDILLNEKVIGTGSNIFLKKEIVEKVIGFDESFKRHQDLEFLMRVCEYSKIVNLNEFLIVKSTNKTNNIPNYINYKKAKEIYFKKFKNDIENLSIENRRYFYDYNYSILLKNALKTKRYEFINEAIEDLSKFRTINEIERINIFMAKNGVDLTSRNKIIRYIGSKIKRFKLKNKLISSGELNNEMLSFIEEYL